MIILLKYHALKSNSAKYTYHGTVITDHSGRKIEKKGSIIW